MAKITEIFVDTGEVIEREPNAAEIEQYQKDQLLDQKMAVNATEEIAKKTESRLAAISHAKSLGFTDEMISVMYPTLLEE